MLLFSSRCLICSLFVLKCACKSALGPYSHFSGWGQGWIESVDRQKSHNLGGMETVHNNSPTDWSVIRRSVVSCCKGFRGKKSNWQASFSSTSLYIIATWWIGRKEGPPIKGVRRNDTRRGAWDELLHTRPATKNNAASISITLINAL